MQGDAEIIELLNEVLTAELTAVNQYFIHAKMQQNWGYPRIAHHTRDESIDEMRHAERVIERILYLEGVPNLQRLWSLRVGESVPEQIRLDLEVEYEAVARLNRCVEAAVAKGDNGSRELFETILVDEEEHVDWLETQLAAIEAIGEANYLAQQLYE
ncbi:bacterioferritin [Actinomarinicola tropica]|uniref:Bacterioferritin n=1 Tax=Actinomarinicola tropica TaxID=2789776 RepID=A0A5Q2RN87_9ACTN|nr:bacterioferritin [Actinomarinicola tropica]QGG95876.1 bacterioferritin [Actinomarinicola tropica]